MEETLAECKRRVKREYKEKRRALESILRNAKRNEREAVRDRIRQAREQYLDDLMACAEAASAREKERNEEREERQREEREKEEELRRKHLEENRKRMEEDRRRSVERDRRRRAARSGSTIISPGEWVEIPDEDETGLCVAVRISGCAVKESRYDNGDGTFASRTRANSDLATLGVSQRPSAPLRERVSGPSGTISRIMGAMGSGESVIGTKSSGDGVSMQTFDKEKCIVDIHEGCCGHVDTIVGIGATSDCVCGRVFLHNVGAHIVTVTWVPCV